MTRPRTQKERVLNYLQTFKTITSRECFDRLNILDLQHSIMELRKEGYKITDTWIQGEFTKYKIYRLEN